MMSTCTPPTKDYLPPKETENKRGHKKSHKSDYMKPPTKEYLPPKQGSSNKHAPHEEINLFSHENVDIRTFSKEYLASGMSN